jgi:hypothetical protein
MKHGTSAMSTADMQAVRLSSRGAGLSNSAEDALAASGHNPVARKHP